MIPIQIHLQNEDGDTFLYNELSVQVFLPAIPRIGDTVILSPRQSIEFLHKILYTKSDQGPAFYPAKWRNLINIDYFDKQKPFLTTEHVIIVDDILFVAADSTAHVSLTSKRETEYKEEITPKVLATLKDKFEKGKIH